MPGCLTAVNPSAQDSLQAVDVELQEQFTLYRGDWNAAAADPDVGQRLPAQPFAPRHDTQLVPVASQERHHGDEQQIRRG